MLAERLATLEMRELNERQRADLAVTRYRQTKEALSHLEERNTELEERVSELSRKLLESQAKEGELSDRLAGEGSGTSFSPPSSFSPSLFSFLSLFLTLCSPLSNFTMFLTLLSLCDSTVSPLLSSFFHLAIPPTCTSLPHSPTLCLSSPLVPTKSLFLSLPQVA